MVALRGESHPSSKLTNDQVLEIRNLWSMGHRNVQVMARRNGVSTANILKIIQRKSWTHI